MSLELIAHLSATFISVLAFVVSIVTLRAAGKQGRIDNLVTLHHFLHQPDLSEARRRMREELVSATLQDPCVRNVCSSFDLAGTLVRHGAVDRHLFLDYWALPLVALDEKLTLLAQRETGAVQVVAYYKDLYWLLDQARRQLNR